MDGAITEACHYVTKFSKKKVTADNISNYLCNTGAHNTDMTQLLKL